MIYVNGWRDYKCILKHYIIQFFTLCYLSEVLMGTINLLYVIYLKDICV